MGTQVRRSLHLGKSYFVFLVLNVTDRLPDRRCDGPHGPTNKDGAQDAANVSRDEGTPEKRHCLTVRHEVALA